MKRKLFLILLFGMVVSLAGIQPAQTSTISFDLDYAYDGAEPEGTVPWLTAHLDDFISNPNPDSLTNTIRLTLDATNLIGNQKIGGWWFNIVDEDEDVFLRFLDEINFISGTPAPHPDPTCSTGAGSNAYRAGSAHDFDIELLFLTRNNGGGVYNFSAGDTIIYDFIFSEPVPVDVFSFLADNDSGSGPFRSAAHVQSIGEDEVSGWIADNPDHTPSPVPEPATMLLVGMGLVGLAGFGRRRFKA